MSHKYKYRMAAAKKLLCVCLWVIFVVVGFVCIITWSHASGQRLYWIHWLKKLNLPGQTPIVLDKKWLKYSYIAYKRSGNKSTNCTNWSDDIAFTQTEYGRSVQKMKEKKPTEIHFVHYLAYSNKISYENYSFDVESMSIGSPYLGLLGILCKTHAATNVTNHSIEHTYRTLSCGIWFRSAQTFFFSFFFAVYFTHTHFFFYRLHCFVCFDDILYFMNNYWILMILDSQRLWFKRMLLCWLWSTEYT